VLQVGHLPRIMTRCTVNKILKKQQCSAIWKRFWNTDTIWPINE